MRHGKRDEYCVCPNHSLIANRPLLPSTSIRPADSLNLELSTTLDPCAESLPPSRHRLESVLASNSSHLIQHLIDSPISIHILLPRHPHISQLPHRLNPRLQHQRPLNQIPIRHLLPLRVPPAVTQPLRRPFRHASLRVPRIRKQRDLDAWVPPKTRSLDEDPFQSKDHGFELGALVRGRGEVGETFGEEGGEVVAVVEDGGGGAVGCGSAVVTAAAVDSDVHYERHVDLGGFGL